MTNTSRNFHRLVVGTIVLLLIACSSENNDTELTNSNTTKTKPVSVTEQQIATVSLEDADADRGQRFFLQCKACHTITKDGENLIGPNLWGIIDSAAGKKSDFAYSEGFQQATFTWDLDTLNQFLIKPNDMIPGTTMIFVGINDPNMRNDILAYLIEASAN